MERGVGASVYCPRRTHPIASRSRRQRPTLRCWSSAYFITAVVVFRRSASYRRSLRKTRSKLSRPGTPLHNPGRAEDEKPREAQQRFVGVQWHGCWREGKRHDLQPYAALQGLQRRTLRLSRARTYRITEAPIGRRRDRSLDIQNRKAHGRSLSLVCRSHLPSRRFRPRCAKSRAYN